MSDMPGELVLTDLEILEFTATLPTPARVLARQIMFNRFVYHSAWAYARLFRDNLAQNELVDYIANWPEDHLDEAYANVMEDVLNDWMARWRSGTL